MPGCCLLMVRTEGQYHSHFIEKYTLVPVGKPGLLPAGPEYFSTKGIFGSRSHALRYWCSDVGSQRSLLAALRSRGDKVGARRG